MCVSVDRGRGTFGFALAVYMKVYIELNEKQGDQSIRTSRKPIKPSSIQQIICHAFALLLYPTLPSLLLCSYSTGITSSYHRCDERLSDPRQKSTMFVDNKTGGAIKPTLIPGFLE